MTWCGKTAAGPMCAALCGGMPLERRGHPTVMFSPAGGGGIAARWPLKYRTLFETHRWNQHLCYTYMELISMCDS